MTHWWYITLAWRWLATWWWWWSNRRHKSSAHGCIERTTTWRLHAGRMQSCITPHDCWKRLFSRLVQNKKNLQIFLKFYKQPEKKIKQVKILFKTNKQNKTPQKIKNKTPLSEAGRKKFNQNFHSLLRHWHARHLLANQSYSVSAVGQKTWKPATKPRVIWRHSSPDGRRLKM